MEQLVRQTMRDLDKIYLNEHQAKNLAQKMCAIKGFKQYQVIFSETESESLKGICEHNLGRIRLFGDGETVGTLIHEIAHIPNRGIGHGRKFWETVLELADRYWWLKEQEIQPSRVTVVELATEMMAELETEIVTPVMIGKRLLEEKMNTEENMTKMRKILTENGFKIMVPKKKDKPRGYTD